MDRLRLMGTFVNVVNAGSFAAAASRLGLSRAVVSRHVAELESHLGARLLNRTTRALAVTETGADYFDFCRRILSEIDAREAAVGRSDAALRGTLRVTAPKSFGSSCLGEAILGFADEYPKIQLTLILNDFTFKPSDFVEDGFDMALRLSRVRDAAVKSHKLATLRWLLVASPRYLDAAPSLTAPPDLSSHNCLAHVNLDENDRVWVFDGPDGAATVRIGGSFLSNSALVLRGAALRGAGAAILPNYLVKDDIGRGDLVHLLPDYRVPDRPLYALYPHAKRQPRKVALLTAYLKDWFQARGPSL